MVLQRLLNFLFGTEEHVNMRRQLVLLREKLLRFLYIAQHYYVICSGSLGEGVAYPKSDDDRMIYNSSQRVVKTYREATQREVLLMVPSENSLGYCMLLDVRGTYPADVIHIFDEMTFVSSTLWKLKELKEGESIHGPCRSRIFGFYEYDTAHCIRCPFWPDVAREWIIRNRPNIWPSPELIQNLVEGGCHVVPIGDQDSPLCQHEWRISFSVAERTLMHSFNHTQFLTYCLLRLALKRVIEKGSPGVLCSYFMKTTLFFTSEMEYQQFRRLDSVETCFRACLSELYKFVDNRYCPNYFIPEYNMMKRKVNHTNRPQLLDIIRTLHTVGIVGTLQFSGESIYSNQDLSFSFIEWKLDNAFMFSYYVTLAVETLRDVIEVYGALLPTENLLCHIHSLLQDNSTQIYNLIFHIGVIHCCQHMMHQMMSVRRKNKNDYCLHKIIKCLLRVGYRRDVTTGKLTAATYMYLVGKTKSALMHTQRMLSDYPPYTMSHKTNIIQVMTYMEAMCSKGYSMDYKTQCACAPPYFAQFSFLNAYPLPLRMWISIMHCDQYCFLPVSYAYLLESLCHIRQNNRTSLKKSTRCLIDQTKEDIEDYWIANIKMCVAIIKYAQGDSRSACRWFGSAYVMKDATPSPLNERFSISALSYIACLIHKRLLTEG